jgi:hypothetical protein
MFIILLHIILIYYYINIVLIFQNHLDNVETGDFIVQYNTSVYSLPSAHT